MSGHLEDLLARLNSGDRAAADSLFQKYEPFLKMVVHRRLTEAMRVKFDSSDIVQSAWVDVWEGLSRGRWTFHYTEQFKAFLVKTTCNRLVDCFRRNFPHMLHEQRLLEGDEASVRFQRFDSALEVASAKELWDRILAACPDEHREIVRLKRVGLSSVEIALRVGMHESSVRRILDDVRRRLNLKQFHPA